MSEESTTPDLVERWRQTNEAFVRRDFDAMMRFFAPDAVWDLSSAGIGRFEGAAAIGRFHEDWIGSYEEYENQLEAQDLGNDLSFVVLSLDARPADSAGRVRERWGFTVTWAAGMIVRVIASTDIDEARAAAERLAEELPSVVAATGSGSGRAARGVGALGHSRTAARAEQFVY
jgi:ketosteroid isomerase-like protein